MLLTHLKHTDINFIRWDQCIENSVGGLPYAMSWYLNIVSPNWEALVSTDYQYVMPITTKSKYKLKYIVQPPITQQLGVFSNKITSEEIVRLFITKIPYLSYHIHLNAYNYITKLQTRPNYIVALNKAYGEIKQAYSKNCIRNINKAKKLSLRIELDTDYLELIEFLVHNTTEKNEEILTLFKQIISIGYSQNKTKNVGIRNNNGDLIAAVCFLVTPKGWVYLLAASNEEGKSSSAMFALVDSVIQENATSELVLDFEGSIISEIARFYKGFGAINHPYYTAKRLRPNLRL